MDLKSKLNTAKNIAYETPVAERVVQRQSVSSFVGNSDALINNLTEQVFGSKLIDDGSGNTPYDAKAEMKMIQAGIPQDKLQSSKLPSAIKEAIASNPLIVTTTDPKMDAFTAKLAAVQGVQKAANIMNQLDEEDKEKENARKAALNESLQRTSVSVDYNLIKSIVENAVKSLKDELSSELNESINHNRQNNTSLKAIKMGDKFLFLDSEDNIYECQMVYKGKNKSKRQK